MIRVPMDAAKVADCRARAARVADDVQAFVDRHTSVGAERTILRAFGVEGADAEGAPLVNAAVDRVHKAGLLGHGISFALGKALAQTGGDVQTAAEHLAFGAEIDANEGPSVEEIRHLLAPHVSRAIARIDQAREEREETKARHGAGAALLKYVIVATGNIYDDAVQAKAAAHAGADIVAVIRATAQLLLDYVPHGATTEGYGGIFAI